MEMVLVDKSFLEKVELLIQQNQLLLERLDIPEPVVDEWVGIKELQVITGWGRTTLEKWRNQEKFNYRRSSEQGKVLYEVSSVLKFLSENGKQKRS